MTTSLSGIEPEAVSQERDLLNEEREELGQDPLLLLSEKHAGAFNPNLLHPSPINLGWEVVKAQALIEERQDKLVEEKLAELEKLYKKIETATSFLEFLEKEFTGPNNHAIDVHRFAISAEEIHADFPLPLLVKEGSLSHSEAKTLIEQLRHRIAQCTQKLNPACTSLNHCIEQRHEYLSIIRDILKGFREMLATMTRNQRGT